MPSRRLHRRGDSILVYWADLQALLVSARKDVDERIVAATAALTAHDAALDPCAAPRALQTAAAAIFGEGFTLIPTFTLPAAAGAEQTAAHAHFTSGNLLALPAPSLDDAQPLDTWFYGAARVRPKARLLEDASCSGTRTGWPLASSPRCSCRTGPARRGWRSIFRSRTRPTASVSPTSPWPGRATTRRRRAADSCCDDWTETVPALEPDEPGPQHTTGVAFHFDRPSQEPPQAMLLLTPAQWNGAWSWDDIVGGVSIPSTLARLRAVSPTIWTTAPGPVPAGHRRQRHDKRPVVSANYALVNMDVRVVRSV